MLLEKNMGIKSNLGQVRPIRHCNYCTVFLLHLQTNLKHYYPFYNQETEVQER